MHSPGFSAEGRKPNTIHNHLNKMVLSNNIVLINCIFGYTFPYTFLLFSQKINGCVHRKQSFHHYTKTKFESLLHSASSCWWSVFPQFRYIFVKNQNKPLKGEQEGVCKCHQTHGERNRVNLSKTYTWVIVLIFIKKYQIIKKQTKWARIKMYPGNKTGLRGSHLILRHFMGTS